MTKLKEIRMSKGLTQKQLAEKSGINMRVLQHYEQGSKNLDGAKLETLINLSTALKCPLSEILENDELRNKAKNARM